METKIMLVWQAGPCVGGNCEGVYKAPGGYVIQGKKLGPATMARLSRLGDDETAVFITDEAARQVGREG
jgi:hypothetical protein